MLQRVSQQLTKNDQGRTGWIPVDTPCQPPGGVEGHVEQLPAFPALRTHPGSEPSQVLLVEDMPDTQERALREELRGAAPTTSSPTSW
jgi:hypothetical protein